MHQILNEEKQSLRSSVQFNPISYRGGASEAPPSGIGDCSKTHWYINLKVLDFSYISKTKILKGKKIWFFYPNPPRREGIKKMKILKVGQRAKVVKHDLFYYQN